MGTNFYIKSDNTHIGKRSAAGWYCWECDLTLCEAGNEGVHRGASKWHEVCPKCKKEKPQKKDLFSGAAGRELGFDKSPFQRRSGIDSTSSFSWAISPKEETYQSLLKKRGKPIIDEYGRQFSIKEWLSMLEECPIQYEWSIGTVFE